MEVASLAYRDLDLTSLPESSMQCGHLLTLISVSFVTPLHPEKDGVGFLYPQGVSHMIDMSMKNFDNCPKEIMDFLHACGYPSFQLEADPDYVHIMLPPPKSDTSKYPIWPTLSMEIK